MNAATFDDLGDDQRALHALRHGDIGGLDILIPLYQEKAVRTAFLITNDQAAAEDAVSEAFIKVYERIAQFDPRRPFAPWFYRIVINGAITWARRNRLAEPWQDLSEAPNDEPSPHEHIEKSQRRKHVIAAVNRLSPEQRAVVVLRYFHDLNDQAIAQVLGVPHATVRWRMHRAKSLLRAWMTQDNDLQGMWE